jgi:CheY-like chemotaxis protein
LAGWGKAELRFKGMGMVVNRKPAARILVVDDQKPVADTLRDVLRTAGYESTAVYSPCDALQYIDELAPALMVSDVMMPEMDGIELAKRVRARHPGCAILLVSGNAASLRLQETARGLDHDFELLAKPIPPVELLKAVAQLVLSTPPADSTAKVCAASNVA